MRTHASEEAGFTLLEALIALALTGLIFSGIAAVISNWVPHWSHGYAKLQSAESLAVSLQRISDDLSASRFLPARADSPDPLFVGRPHSVTFVRSAWGPNGRGGLEVVRFSQVVQQGGRSALIRARSAYAQPGDVQVSAASRDDFTVVMDSPYKLTFAYRGIDGIWKQAWEGEPAVPDAIQVTLEGPSDGVTTSVRVHTQIPADCALAQSSAQCARSPTGAAKQ